MIPWNIQIAITNLTGYGSSMGFIKGGWKIEHDTYRIPRNYFKPTTNQPQNNHKTTKHQSQKVGSCRRESTVFFRRLIASFPSMLCLSPASKCRQQCHRKLDMRRIAGLLSLDGRPQAMYVFIFFPLTMGSSPCELSTPRRWKTWNWMGQRPTKQVIFIGMCRGKVGRRSPGFRTHGDFVSTFIANPSYSVNQIVSTSISSQPGQ